MGIERESTISHSPENSLRKRLWTFRTTRICGGGGDDDDADDNTA